MEKWICVLSECIYTRKKFLTIIIFLIKNIGGNEPIIHSSDFFNFSYQLTLFCPAFKVSSSWAFSRKASFYFCLTILYLAFKFISSWTGIGGFTTDHDPIGADFDDRAKKEVMILLEELPALFSLNYLVIGIFKIKFLSNRQALLWEKYFLTCWIFATSKTLFKTL